MKDKLRSLEEWIPFIIFLCMVIIFGILTQGQLFAPKNLMFIVEQTLNIVLAGLGLVFVAAIGGTDITQGSLVALAAAFGASVSVDVTPLMAIPVVILIGLTSGFVLGMVNAKFKVPSFMASLAMLIALRASVSLTLRARTIILPETLRTFDEMYVKVPVVIVLTLIAIYVFDFTPFGAYCRAIGENEKAARFTGINVNKVKVAAFMISGLSVGIASLFILARVGGASNVLGVGYEMRILMALFIGGIPVRGGSGTKVYKMIVGAFLITLLENGLTISGISGSMIQMIRGLILLSVVYIMIISKKRISLENQ